MKVIEARNVNDAFARALTYLKAEGQPRDSRNGPVYVSPVPVATVYTRPQERVLFSHARDANPFLHLYESLWMLQGRNDASPLIHYARNFAAFSDDGETFHGAYGYRWRRHFLLQYGTHVYDQLRTIIEMLRKNPDDRRAVLQIWDSRIDLGHSKGKDIPCNLTVTFQIDSKGKVNMVVFCRSNDILWGCYGANAVHFSFLLEYVANHLHRSMGTYTQVSVNWHGYAKTLTKLGTLWESPGLWEDTRSPYVREVAGLPVVTPTYLPSEPDPTLCTLMEAIDNGEWGRSVNTRFEQTVLTLMEAHSLWKTLKGEERYAKPLALLNSLQSSSDWIQAAKDWIQRRFDRSLLNA